MAYVGNMMTQMDATVGKGVLKWPYRGNTTLLQVANCLANEKITKGFNSN